jgi:hypothetical protein
LTISIAGLPENQQVNPFSFEITAIKLVIDGKVSGGDSCRLAVLGAVQLLQLWDHHDRAASAECIALDVSHTVRTSAVNEWAINCCSARLPAGADSFCAHAVFHSGTLQAQLMHHEFRCTWQVVNTTCSTHNVEQVSTLQFTQT